MLRRVVLVCVLAAVGLLAMDSRGWAQIAPEDASRPLPPGVRELRESRSGAYAFGRAWKGMAARARLARESRGGQALERAVSAGAVQGNVQIPVFLVRFANTDSVQYPPLELEEALFSTQPDSLTLRAYYLEQSQGLLNVGGQVFGWHVLPQADTYYEGSSNGLTPNDAKTGELIANTLVAYDPAVDFGLYDNDGPDGVPNSGDDDGYVDFVAFVHAEAGGECGGTGPNLWSHRWRYTAWPVSGSIPFQTNDPSANGGTILIDDYVLQPGLRCGGVGRVQIGVFCHEFGHAFGLPDLYDINGGGAQGIGHWGLMASGNWNSPDRPAHMSAWTKQELGWVQTVEIPWPQSTVVLGTVETSRTIYELRLPDRRWGRRTDCVLAGSASLAVGLTAAESAARGWNAAKGYGNGWWETVAHDFRFDGIGPVSFDYDYQLDSESGFDFAFVLAEVGGVETTLAVYDGSSAGHATHDLTGVLGAGATDYRLKFRFRSDEAFSNEDGNYVSTCSPFLVDNIVVAGGGEDYRADFEVHRQGWFQPSTDLDNPLSESWLVENRQPLGFDAQLHGSGLLLYHLDREVLQSASGNSGGNSESRTRGLVVQEGDGRFDLLAAVGGNRGDSGDPWPGTSAAALFDSSTTPTARTNAGRATNFVLRDPVARGDSIQVVFEGGAFPPRLTGVSPDTASVDSSTIRLQIVGGQEVQPGCLLRLVSAGHPDIVSTRAWWEDFDRVSFDLDPSGGALGSYDVVLENPDGQTAALSAALTLVSSATTIGGSPALPQLVRLAQNYPNPFNPRTTIRYDLPTAGRVLLRIHDLHGRRVRTLVDATLDAGFHRAEWDGKDDSGRSVASGIYLYRLDFGSARFQQKMLLLR